MGVAYRLMYFLGFTPWDHVLPPELTKAIEGPAALPSGRALDLGSGLGSKSIYMARHGWVVTGIEMVPRALREARRRAHAEGVSVDFRRGDVTRLGELRLEPGFTLIFDFGCYHGLKSSERQSYADGVTALAAPGAKLLMMGFTQPLPPVITAVTDSELRDRFGRGWELLWSRPDQAAGTSAMSRGAAGWFCLTRNPLPPSGGGLGSGQ